MCGYNRNKHIIKHLPGCCYLVRAVDLGSVLQKEMHNLSVASTCRPDDGIHTVLLRERAKIMSAVRLTFSDTSPAWNRSGESSHLFVTLKYKTFLCLYLYLEL